MPIKRRRDKSRTLDTMKLHELQYGPGECLFNGCGYLADYGDGLWRDVPDNQKPAVLEEMRADWQRHAGQVLQSWADRSEHDLWIAAQHYGSPAEPWAMREFGLEN